LSPIERELLGTDDDHHLVGRWEEHPLDLLVVATVMWRDLGLTPDLPDICAQGVPEAITGCPWTHGGHSVRRFIELLADTLTVEGFFERAPRAVGVADVVPAMLAVIREEQPPQQEDLIRIVVEGTTDATYLEAAARLAHEAWGTELLSGCRVAPPGEDREGGANKIVRELIALEARGVIAAGLFDDDEPGRVAIKAARIYTKQKVHLLPAEFDPLNNPKGSGTIEIEDLVSRTLIERFHGENDELQPEERTTRRTLVRVVVAGPDKERAAAWICEHASFEDMEKIVYVLCMLRQGFGLALPKVCPPLANWMRELDSR